MAHKKGAGSTRNGRESHSKRLGVKLYGGETAIAGNIIIRQRGTKYHPGTGVGLGKDHTIFATTDGIVTFTRKKDNTPYVSVLPAATETAVAEKPKKKAAPKAEAPAAEAKPATKKTAAKKEEGEAPAKKTAPKKKEDKEEGTAEA